MKSSHLLVSLVGLLLGFLMITSGFFLFLVPYVPEATAAARSLAMRHLMGLSYFGLALLFFGLLFLTLFVWLNRRRYFLLKMGGVSIEDRLIAFFAQESVQKFFPGQPVECDVIIRRKGKIEIVAQIPYLAEKQQKQMFFAIEKELSAILRQQCQYEREFILNVSFSETS